MGSFFLWRDKALGVYGRPAVYIIDRKDPKNFRWLGPSLYSLVIEVLSSLVSMTQIRNLYIKRFYRLRAWLGHSITFTVNTFFAITAHSLLIFTDYRKK